MDMDLLRLALGVARQGSLAGAARTLGRDPSTVSRGLAALEAEIGVRLFERSTRSLAPTEAGAEFLDRIAALVDGFDEAREAATTGRMRPRGTLRLTASIAFGHDRLVPELAGFRAAHPEIALDLALSDAPLDLVAEGLDLALRLAPDPSGDLISTKLCATSYRVVAAPAWRAAHGPPAAPAALADVPCLRLSLAGYRDGWVFRPRGGGGEERVPVAGPITISNPLALRAAAVAGLGPTLLADWMVAEALAEGRLVDLFPGWEVTATRFDTAVWALYPSRSFLPRKTRAMIDHLRRAWGGRGAGLPSPVG